MAAIEGLDEVIGLRVQAARKEMGLSQESVGRRLGLTKGGYGQYERGLHPFTAEQMYQLSAILEHSVPYFLGLDNGLSPAEDRVLSLYGQAKRAGREDLFMRIAEVIASSKT